jgi:hypothetical protein
MQLFFIWGSHLVGAKYICPNVSQLTGIHCIIFAEYFMLLLGCAIAQVVSRLLPSVAAWICIWAGHVGFAVDKMALG